MTALPVLKEATKTNILLAALILATGTIPLYNNLNSICLIVFVFACVIQRPIPETLRRLGRPSLWMMPALYALWFTCSYFWDVTGGYAARDIERYSSLLFIPPALAILPKLPLRVIRITCMVFVAVTSLMCLVCLAKSYQEYQLTGDYRVFYYHYLASQVQLNAIFLSNYCLASIIWLLYFGFVQHKNVSPGGYIIICLVIAFLFAMILLLSSKLIIFLLLMMLMGFICYIGYLRGYLIRSLVVIALMIAAGIFAVNHLSYVKWRLNVTSLKKYSGKEDNNNGLSIRILMWQNAWDLIKQRPLLGYGIRGGREKMVEAFKKENFALGYKEGYHSHNQYLESALMGGVAAFFLFTGMIVMAGWKALRKRNMLLIFMLFHFLCQNLIESTYEVQQELVFYIFFLFLFYYHSPSVRQKNRSAINENDAVL